LTISNKLYDRLEAEATKRGMSSVQQLLEGFADGRDAAADEHVRREAAVQRILGLRAKFVAAYGEMPDSVELIREDRER
jgi:hypothetical protein